MRKSIVILGYPGVQALDIVGPSDVFAGATQYLHAQAKAAGRAPNDGYAIALVSVDGGPIAASGGLEFGTSLLPDDVDSINTVVVPGGFGTEGALHSSELIDWLRRAAAGSARVATVCTGSFIAARAGLLDGCSATTHWGWARQMADEFPEVRVDPDPIFTRSSERVWTSAGVSAGIDLCLALVEEDFGSDLAATVARGLVLYLRRPGGQTQFAPPVWMPRAKRAPIRAVQDSIEANPGAPHSITELARRAAMSPLHFTRMFAREVGESPGLYVERIRTDAARRQLEQTDDTLAVIAARCGFGSSETLRRNFVRRLGVTPDSYRKTFA